MSSLISCMQGWPLGVTLFRSTIISHLKSATLISLPKEELNLIVMVKVIADSQLKKSMLPTHTAPPLPSSPILSKMQVSWERKGVEGKQERWKGYLWSFPSLSLTGEGTWLGIVKWHDVGVQMAIKYLFDQIRGFPGTSKPFQPVCSERPGGFQQDN